MTELLKMGIVVANSGWLCLMVSRVYGNIRAGPVVSAGPWLNPEWLSLGGGGQGASRGDHRSHTELSLLLSLVMW